MLAKRSMLRPLYIHKHKLGGKEQGGCKGRGEVVPSLFRGAEGPVKELFRPRKKDEESKRSNVWSAGGCRRLNAI